jgi:hypothetical protein
MHWTVVRTDAAIEPIGACGAAAQSGRACQPTTQPGLTTDTGAAEARAGECASAATGGPSTQPR